MHQLVQPFQSCILVDVQTGGNLTAGLLPVISQEIIYSLEFRGFLVRRLCRRSWFLVLGFNEERRTRNKELFLFLTQNEEPRTVRRSHQFPRLLSKGPFPGREHMYEPCIGINCLHGYQWRFLPDKPAGREGQRFAWLCRGIPLTLEEKWLQEYQGWLSH